MRLPIMIVGLNPSRRGHNESGIPFRMRNGALTPSSRTLITAFEKLGVRLEDFYFTELTKCHAPNNVPTTDEIKNCRPYLVEEMRLLRPRRVVALGGMVANELRRLGVGENLIRLNHPSYVQRFLVAQPG
jgi:uracil-DNA glycosylase family 4